MIEWLQMGGYGFYVWSSYGMLALALAIEVAALRRHRRAAVRRAADLRAEYADETASALRVSSPTGNRIR